MLFTRQIGDIKVSHFIELSAPTHDPFALYPDIDRQDLEAELDRIRGWLAPHHWCERVNRLIVTYQFWILQIRDKVVIVDGGVGNRKSRPAPRMDNMNTTFLPWLASLGVERETVDLVINTHLHTDHVGWNTMGPENQPTFPRAKYLFPKRDFDYFGEMLARDPSLPGSLSFSDSVLPVHRAGLAELYDGAFDVLDGLSVEAAPGHTPGHSIIRLTSGAARAVICGDLYHSPLQIALPDLNSKNDALPDAARQTRRRFTEEAADSGMAILPCHFGRPFCGNIVRDIGGSFRFRPVELPD